MGFEKIIIIILLHSAKFIKIYDLMCFTIVTINKMPVEMKLTMPVLISAADRKSEYLEMRRTFAQ